MSNTGQYLQPTTQPLPGGLPFKKFIQTVFAGISGLPPDMVRNRWQPNPPKQPDIFTNWLAIGLQVNKGDDNAFVGQSLGQKSSGIITFQNNPQLLDTITVNGVIFTFVSSPPGVNQVLIGNLPSDTALNLQASLAASADILLTVATYSSFGEGILIAYKTIGSIGNTFTLTASTSVIVLSGANLSGGSNFDNLVLRHEDLQIQCSFYGPDAADYGAIVRDGFEMPQNRYQLNIANMGYVESTQLMRVPDLVNERWVDRYEMTVRLRREIQRVYSVLPFTSIHGTILTDSSGVNNIAFNVQA